MPIAKIPRTERRLRTQAGHAAMEGAFVLVPFLSLFFALMDFSMAIFLKNTMQFSVRQGVRYAITSQTGATPVSYSNDTDYVPGSGQDVAIKNTVVSNAFGYLHYAAPSGSGRPCSGRACITIRYFDPITLAEQFGTGSNAGGNVVQVTAQNLTWAWMIPLMRSASTFNFTVSSADVMEASPTSGIPAR